MILITVVDDGGGLLFNHRRQSQDRVLRERILSMARTGRLWMNAFSAKQFPADESIQTDEAFLEKAGRGEYCFLEDCAAAPAADRIERVILFRWNRAYPGDFFFDLDLTSPPWKLVESEEFPGYSHEKITKEVYEHA